MSNQVYQVRKLPVDVQAMRYDGTAENSRLIVQWVNSLGGEAEQLFPGVLRIITLEGAMLARVGWWVIRGVKGEFYPCDPDIFDQTYELVPNTRGVNKSYMTPSQQAKNEEELETIRRWERGVSNQVALDLYDKDEL